MGLIDVGLRFIVQGTGLEKLDAVDKKLLSLDSTVAKVSSGLGAMVSVYGLYRAFDSITKTMDAMHDLANQADRLSMTTEALGGLQYAAKMSGVELGTFNTAIETFSRTLGKAALGSVETSASLHALNLQYAQLKGLSVGEAFSTVAERLKGVSDATERAAIATKLFGRGSAEMLNMLDQGSAGLARLQDEADRLGVTFSRADVRGVEEAKQSMDRLGAAWQGLKQQLAVSIAPTLTRTMEAATHAIKEPVDTLTGLALETTIRLERMSQHLLEIMAHSPGNAPMMQIRLDASRRQLDQWYTIQE